MNDHCSNPTPLSMREQSTSSGFVERTPRIEPQNRTASAAWFQVETPSSSDVRNHDESSGSPFGLVGHIKQIGLIYWMAEMSDCMRRRKAIRDLDKLELEIAKHQTALILEQNKIQSQSEKNEKEDSEGSLSPKKTAARFDHPVPKALEPPPNKEIPSLKL
ncbi:hypothetical protein TNCV_679941 [Trichonephila clavipes]|nr:hypothetical protein TNCV_679941 [Trichonephila clavipes]